MKILDRLLAVFSVVLVMLLAWVPLAGQQRAADEKAATTKPLEQKRVTEGAGSTIFGNVCRQCHGVLEAAPADGILKQMSPEHIYDILQTTHAANRAKDLTDQQRRDIAEWVGGRKLGATASGDAQAMSNACPDTASISDLSSMPSWNGWSADMANKRFQQSSSANLSPAAVTRLELKWAFGLPAAASAYGQPTVVDGKVFVTSDSAYLYALDAATGCVHWSFLAQAGVRSATVIGPIQSGAAKFAVFFGDIRGNVYAVNTSNGELLWKTSIDPHPLSRITGGIRFHSGRLYVPVASLEEPESSSVNYKCCTFRGMVAALDANTGKQIWKTYPIEETPTERTSADGTKFMGPSGAGVWGAVTIDPKRNAIYLSTGNAFSAPDTGRAEAVMAMDLDSGAILWSVQNQHGDVWHTGCLSGPAPPGFPPRSAARPRIPGSDAPRPAPRRSRPPKPDSYYCPDETNNPDWDFSAGVMLVELPNGRDLLIAGQKSGMVWAHDPDKKGELVWKSDISRGEITFGGGADSEQAYFAFRGGGLAAVRLTDGLERWYTFTPPQESMSVHTGITAAVTVIPGVVFTAGLDGMLRGFSTFDGSVLWEFNTAQEVQTVNGVAASGGSMGSAGATVVNGMVYVASGYTGFQNGHPGNVLLAFGPPDN
jgi:polyvinyl alcohol dehydrogenase (cytochrome)